MPLDRAELAMALREPGIFNWLRSQFIQQTSATSIGRYPGQGSLQNDNFIYRDACDATHPWNADYVMPKNFQRLISAKLSFILRAYRTYSTLTLSSTGTDATGESGHTHSHSHTWHVNFNGAAGSDMGLGPAGLGDTIRGGVHYQIKEARPE